LPERPLRGLAAVMADSLGAARSQCPLVGVASFRLALYVLWPFGRTVVRRPDAGAATAIGNVIWFIFAGLWIAIAHILLGLLLCLTIIGIPLGLGNFKLAVVAIAPLGKDIVSTNDPRAVLGVAAF
jgi:uncharacterized membrane protein YccF (DUF307 family)